MISSFICWSFSGDRLLRSVTSTSCNRCLAVAPLPLTRRPSNRSHRLDIALSSSGLYAAEQTPDPLYKPAGGVHFRERHFLAHHPPGDVAKCLPCPGIRIGDAFVA